MKILQILLLTFIVFISSVWFTDANWWPTGNTESFICQWDDCSFEGGIEASKWSINWLVTDRTLSEYVIQIISYLTTFITLIWVVIVIYAGFTILVSWWDEEKIKSAKRLILYAILWIILIWLAWSIMTFIVSILDGGAEVPDGGGAEVPDDGVGWEVIE